MACSLFLEIKMLHTKLNFLRSIEKIATGRFKKQYYSDYLVTEIGDIPPSVAGALIMILLFVALIEAV